MAVSAGIVMKIHAVNILSQLCLNVHNGSMLCNQFIVTPNDDYGLIAYFNMVFNHYRDFIDQPTSLNKVQ